MTPSKQSGFTTLRRSESGFTLIELLVVLAIVGMLAALAMTALGSTRAKSRDTKRKGDLLNLQKGLELYFTSNNAYPSTSGVWRAVANKDCPDNTITTTGATGYIPNFAPTYVGVLPTDPRPSSGTCSGYNYRSDGTNFKLISNAVSGLGGPENAVSSGQPFYDPARPGTAYMVTSSGSATSAW